MPLYSQLILGDNLSAFAQSINVSHEAMRALERGTAEPTLKPTGLLWNKTNHTTIGEAIMRWNGSLFLLLMDPEFPQINAGGTVAYTANQGMNTFILTGLGAGTANGHSVRYEQVIHRSGALAFTANQAMGGFRLTGLGAPVADDDAARKIDCGGMKLFRTTGPGALLVYSGWTPGTTTFNQRIQTTTFVPERLTLLVRARMLTADSGDLIDEDLRLSLVLTRGRFETDNGGVFHVAAGFVAGTRATGNADTWAILAGDVDNAASGSRTWRSRVITGNAFRDWRVYVRFHTGASPRGVEIWFRRETNEYIDLDEIGGGDEGVCQLLVEGAPNGA